MMSQALINFLGKVMNLTNGTVKTELTGSLPKSEMEGYGATVADRPLANAVPVGYVFMSVSTQEIWQSDGTNWVVV